MKKGFLLTKPAKKVEKLDLLPLVTINYDSKSLFSNCFHDIITDFLSDLVTKNSPFFNSIIFSDSYGFDGFLKKDKNQQVFGSKLIEKINTDDCYPQTAYFLACLLNIFFLDDELIGLLFLDSEIRQEIENYKKRSTKKKACKKKKKALQPQTPFRLDEQVVPTFSAESSEYIPSKPSDSRTVTFNQSLLSSSFTSLSS
ncbi:hypothetical protein RclHR1_00540034 [Rhizophagus clarus]|uniref:Uncharacterized protein n=1 Tax=Rhizophagus clarus TaxID=94130 RepID=A0A2Z6RN95_9GLOM|nr:hypothetical protein RclHR1_00540034 [Rhizophagus clarus]